ncbi:MAG: hypothetical protein AAF604_24410 [Acidobacteriota bacterium]
MVLLAVAIQSASGAKKKKWFTGSTTKKKTSVIKSTPKKVLQPGYGKSVYGRVAKPKTSLYYKSHVGPSRVLSNSYNGFGMGVGAGLTAGYGTGLLSKPIGSQFANFSYDYIHENQTYWKQSSPIKCYGANTTTILELKSTYQEIEIEETEANCTAADDVCFATVSVTQAVFNTAGSSTVSEGLWVNETGTS